MDGKLMATHNYFDLKHYTAISNTTVSAGKYKLKMEFSYEGGKEMGNGPSRVEMHHWLGRDQPEAAQALLVELYGEFTEGWKTVDLRTTKDLLERCHNAP